MKKQVVRNEGFMLILVGGSILFSIGYFLPNEVALQITTFIGGLIGFIIYSRVSNWNINDRALENMLMLGITILMSSWASSCWLVAYNLFFKATPLAENRLNAFIILNFFFPLLLVFSGLLSSWLSERLSRSR